jgi:SanA protein
MLKKIKYTIFTTILLLIVATLFIDLYIQNVASKNIYSSVSKVPKTNVALLLGTAKYIKRGKINYFYKYRIDAVSALYKAGKIKAVLVSGDNATRYYNEPRRMYKDLVKAGIPKDRIYLDFAGFRTLDSIKRAQKIFGLKRYVIISQKFHLERALFLAKANGADAIGFEAKSLENSVASAKMRAREYLARVKAFLDVYILHTTPKFFGKFEKIPIKENQN